MRAEDEGDEREKGETSTSTYALFAEEQARQSAFDQICSDTSLGSFPDRRSRSTCCSAFSREFCHSLLVDDIRVGDETESARMRVRDWVRDEFSLRGR